MDYSYLFRHHTVGWPHLGQRSEHMLLIGFERHVTEVPFFESGTSKMISLKHTYGGIFIIRLLMGFPSNSSILFGHCTHDFFHPKNGTYMVHTHIYITHIYIYCFYVYTMTNLTTNSSIFEHCQVDQDLYLARFPTISGCGAARTKRVSSRKKRLGLVESRFFISSFADYKVVPPSYKLIYNPINYRYITYKP